MKPRNPPINSVKVSTSANRLTRLLFAIYLVVLCWILLLKLGVRFSYMQNRRANLVPFSSALTPQGIDVAETVLNIIVFIPFGIYLGLLCKGWRFGKKLLVIFIASCAVEVLQYIFAIGAFDTTDIVTNTFGGVTGLAIIALLLQLFSNAGKAQRFVNALAAIATVIMVVLLVLLKLNLLPLRYQ